MAVTIILLLTVTLATLAPDSVWTTVSPAVVQRGTLTTAVPSDVEDASSDAAEPVTAQTNPMANSNAISRQKCIWNIKMGRAVEAASAAPA